MTNCHGLKLEAADGKKYMTDVLATRDVLRLIQSIGLSRFDQQKAAIQWARENH